MRGSTRRKAPSCPWHGLLAILAIALLAPASASASDCAGAGADPSATALSEIERATRCLLNERRRERGERPLKGSGKLHEAAERHSDAMERGNFFSHVSPGGTTIVDRIRRTGYLDGSTSWAVGENIAWGSGASATPRSVVRAWMDSRGHKRNILRSSFRDLGVGVSRGAPVGGVGDAATYTTGFGRN